MAAAVLPPGITVGGVDVDERDLVGAWKQRRRAGQAGEEGTGHPVELAVVPVGERAQERAQGRGRAHAAEEPVHRAVPQPVHIVNAVRAHTRSRYQCHRLRARVGAAAVVGPVDAQSLRDHPRQAGPLGQADQPSIRDQVRLVEGSADRHDGMGRIAARGCSLALWTWNRRKSHHPGQRASAPSCPGPGPAIDRWIRAQAPHPAITHDARRGGNGPCATVRDARSDEP